MEFNIILYDIMQMFLSRKDLILSSELLEPYSSKLYPLCWQIYNLHGCTLKCMGVHRPPESTIIRYPNSTVKLKGTAIKLFKFIRRTLNFTTDKIIHHVPNNLREQEYLNDTTCIGMVRLGRAPDNTIG